MAQSNVVRLEHLPTPSVSWAPPPLGRDGEDITAEIPEVVRMLAMSIGDEEEITSVDVLNLPESAVRLVASNDTLADDAVPDFARPAPVGATQRLEAKPAAAPAVRSSRSSRQAVVRAMASGVLAVVSLFVLVLLGAPVRVAAAATPHVYQPSSRTPLASRVASYVARRPAAARPASPNRFVATKPAPAKKSTDLVRTTPF